MSIQAQMRPRLAAHGRTTQRLAIRMVEADLDRRVPRVKGNLARSKKIRNADTLTTSRTTIAYTAKQADFTDRGTRPHIIRPRRARVLRFPRHGRGAAPVGARGNRGRRAFSPVGVVYAKVVHHPGNRGTRWFSGAVTQSKWSGYVRAAARLAGR